MQGARAKTITQNLSSVYGHRLRLSRLEVIWVEMADSPTPSHVDGVRGRAQWLPLGVAVPRGRSYLVQSVACALL
jgi:hypothetical protein